MNSFTIIVLIIICSVVLKAQEEEPDRTNIRPVITGYYINPSSVNEGILLTDEKSQNLFLLRESDTIPLLFFDVLADFKNYYISSDKKTIGFKKHEDSICYLLRYDFDTRKISIVFSSENYCSNLSFSENNKTIFSSDNTVYVISKDDTLKHHFKERIVNVFTSPDGNKLAILTQKGVLEVIETASAKTIKKLSEFTAFFKWSPDSKKLIYSNNLTLNVWDSETNEIYNHGEGISPSWLEDSEYIIFQKNTPIKLKFVNADLYVSKYDVKENYQITNTINTFEMQPIFISKNEILYLTYEDRQIIKARLSEFKIEDQKILFKISQ